MLTASSQCACVFLFWLLDTLNLRFDKGFEMTSLSLYMRGNIKMRRDVFLAKQNGDLKASVMSVRNKWGKIGSTKAY